MSKAYIYFIQRFGFNEGYIGKHKINENKKDISSDNYFGSGCVIRNMIKKHGKDSFVKYVLEIFDSEDEAFKKENDYIDMYKSLGFTLYNIAPGGEGFTSESGRQTALNFHKNLSIEDKEDWIRKKNEGLNSSADSLEKMRQATIRRYENASKEDIDRWFAFTKTEEFSKKRSENMTGEKNTMYNRSLNDVWVLKYGEEEALKKRSEWITNIKSTLSSKESKDRFKKTREDTLKRQKQLNSYSPYKKAQNYCTNLTRNFNLGYISKEDYDLRFKEAKDNYLRLKEIFKKEEKNVTANE